ncbi:MAG: methionine biosynthesis protein MetW [Psychrobacter glaciei]|jgi:methionine biosynthesis protein MetW
MKTESLRSDLNIIQNWVKKNSRIIDLGCGDGELLSYLKNEKQCKGYGLEINPDSIVSCVEKGLNVIEHNLNDGLKHFKDDAMDTVIMTQALQAVSRPDVLLDDMLRVGKEAIITFPNFGYWRTRFYLLTKGKMPMSKTLPFNWYDTPNIHMCTFRDFEKLCREKGLTILNRTVVDKNHNKSLAIRTWPNMLGEFAIYRVTK